MKLIRFAVGAIACGVTMSAAAIPSTTYNFANPIATTGATSATYSTGVGGYNTTNGTNYGNSITFAANGGGSPVTVTGWASTGNGGGYNGQIQSAFVSRYGSNELAITSRSPVNASGTSTNIVPAGTPSSNAELSNGAPNTGNNQHAMDNVGAYESLMFSFQSAVTLADVAIGFPAAGSGLDADATVLVYTGAGAPPSFAARTFADLVAPGGGWQIAGNALNMQTLGHGAVTTSLASKYWMVGAYMNIGTNTASNGGNDYIKVSGLTVTPRVVPEPGSLALLGIASLAMLARRRKKASAR